MEMEIMRFTPPVDSSLHKLWPDGVDGEMIHVTSTRVHLRVVIDKESEGTAVVITEWKNVGVA